MKQCDRCPQPAAQDIKLTVNGQSSVQTLCRACWGKMKDGLDIWVRRGAEFGKPGSMK